MNNEDVAQFCLNSLECHLNWEEAQLRYYPDLTAFSIKQKYDRLLNYKTELFGCYTFIMKYPDTDFKFKPKLLTVVLKNFPVFHKYRTGEYKEGTMGHKIQILNRQH